MLRTLLVSVLARPWTAPNVPRSGLGRSPGALGGARGLPRRLLRRFFASRNRSKSVAERARNALGGPTLPKSASASIWGFFFDDFSTILHRYFVQFSRVFATSSVIQVHLRRLMFARNSLDETACKAFLERSLPRSVGNPHLVYNTRTFEKATNFAKP